jgi:crotonobetainyl-CoA:carnitine CoA-transferase CaiB-like acyl-CoA transferase
MTGYELTASCLPDPRAERAHLAGLLPADVLSPAGPTPPTVGPADCAVLSWARSGLMHLTGLAAGPPLAPAAPVLTRATAMTAAIAELASQRRRRVRLEPYGVFARRAGLNGWRRHGTVSANGTCQLLHAADGWLAVSLSRPVDVRSLSAVLGRELDEDPWAELRSHAATRPAAAVAAAAQLVGIPAAAVGSEASGSKPPLPVRFSRLGAPGPASGLVLDLSAMWAGPLCASILGRVGWRVLKVEDSRRPDGARSGPAQFYASLHAGGPAVQLDFGSAAGRAELRRLAGLAGIIVESSRPRALRALGLVAADWLRAAPGRVWISVTGYGRDDLQQRVAFGDDAAAAGGLVACAPDGTPVFCGDAIADPLTGLHAGLAALAANVAGGGWLVDVPMAGVCADMVRPASGPAVRHLVAKTGQGWTVSHGDFSQAVRLP